DGAADEGFFASDFTLAEIKRLRAVQDFGERPQQFNGKFEIPTLEEIIGLAKRKSKEKDRPIGIYPEVKHSTYHKSIGLPIERRLVAILAAAGWNHRDAPVIIQSFEQSNLLEVRLLERLDDRRGVTMVPSGRPGDHPVFRAVEPQGASQAHTPAPDPAHRRERRQSRRQPRLHRALRPALRLDRRR